MTTAIDHPTCSLSLEQEPVLKGRLTITGEVKTVTVTSDLPQLQDLVTITERYLDMLLSNNRQGVFSSSAAIRPLDFVTQRLTLRQGEGITQVDLSLTQLYDLSETLSELQAQVPDLSDRRLAVVRPWFRQPTGIAAIFVGAVSVAAAIAAIVSPGTGFQTAQETSPTGQAVDALTGEIIAADPPVEPTAAEPESAALPLAAAPPPPATSTTNQLEVSSDAGAPELEANRQALLEQAPLPEIEPSWDPPADLEQTLSYTLGLNVAGELVEITADDAVADDYQAQLPLPAIATEAEDTDVVTTYSLEFAPDGAVTLLPE